MHSLEEPPVSGLVFAVSTLSISYQVMTSMHANTDTRNATILMLARSVNNSGERRVSLLNFNTMVRYGVLKLSRDCHTN